MAVSIVHYSSPRDNEVSGVYVGSSAKDIGTMFADSRNNYDIPTVYSFFKLSNNLDAEPKSLKCLVVFFENEERLQNFVEGKEIYSGPDWSESTLDHTQKTLEKELKKFQKVMSDDEWNEDEIRYGILAFVEIGGSKRSGILGCFPFGEYLVKEIFGVKKAPK